MRRHLTASLLGSVTLTGLLPLAVYAETPSVATDIAPLGGLVASVMGDLGAPTVIVPANVSPHDFSMRPSQANDLNNADLVFWVGEGLIPTFGRSIDSLATEAHVIDVNDIDGTLILGKREDVLVEVEDDHDHGGEHDDHEEHAEGHEEHDEHAEHEEHEDHEEHDDHEEHAEHEEHDHSGADPHSWLYPENAKLWLGVIAEELSELDPENADIYAVNATSAAAAIDAAVTEAEALLEPVHDTGFVTFHDAYRYYETAFEIKSYGSIASGHAAPPSPAHLAELREIVAAEGVICIFAEPQFNTSLVETVAEGTDLSAAVLDPLGAHITPDANFYPALILDLANAISSCDDP